MDIYFAASVNMYTTFSVLIETLLHKTSCTMTHCYSELLLKYNFDRIEIRQCYTKIWGILDCESYLFVKKTITHAFTLISYEKVKVKTIQAQISL